MMQPRNSNEVVVKEYLPKTGPVLVSVTAINPTMSELIAMGVNATQEPEYLTIGQGEGGVEVRKARVDIYVENKEVNFKGKLALFLENQEWVSSKGKSAIMNDFCQGYFDSFCVWQPSIEAAVAMKGRNDNTWFDAQGARIAYKGEPDLYRFIFTWFNMKPGEDVCKLANLDALFQGNFAELKGFVKMCAANGNVMQVMATANERNGKYYQAINNRIFGRATSRAFVTDFIKYAKEQENSGYPLKEIWSTEFQDMVVPSPVTADPEPVEEVGNLEF